MQMHVSISMLTYGVHYRSRCELLIFLCGNCSQYSTGTVEKQERKVKKCQFFSGYSGTVSGASHTMTLNPSVLQCTGGEKGAIHGK